MLTVRVLECVLLCRVDSSNVHQRKLLTGSRRQKGFGFVDTQRSFYYSLVNLLVSGRVVGVLAR